MQGLQLKPFPRRLFQRWESNCNRYRPRERKTMYPKPVTCYPYKTHSWASGGPQPTPALCTFREGQPWMYLPSSCLSDTQHTRLCSIIYANPRHTGGGQQELQQTQSNFYPVGQSCTKSLSSNFDLLSKHKGQVLLGTWKGRSTTLSLQTEKS